MKRVLVIGNSACTFAVGDAYRRSGTNIFVYGQMPNPGFADIAEVYEVGALDNINAMREFARRVRPDFVFIGPAGPIIAGMTDMLASIGIPVIAPLQKAAQLESSKSFTRQLLVKYNIPGTVKHKVFYSEEGMAAFAEELGGEFVVKADGPMMVMWVQVAGDHFHSIEEGLSYAKKYLKMHGRVVIEEKLVGEEFSLMSFCDGVHTLDMPAVQDFKRALEGDKGQNTGGMGAYTDANHRLPFMKEEDYATASDITRQVTAALRQEIGVPFKGIMFGGFMMTKTGLKVLEYNARIGDPEGIVAFALLKTNFVDLSLALLAGELSDTAIEFEHKASVCKYVVPQGYPETADQTGKKITIGTVPDGVKLYTAWVKKTNGDLEIADYHGASGRAIAVVSTAQTLPEAERLAEAGCQVIGGPVYHRRDIASPECITDKIRRMEMLKQ
ncbi:MAG: phosphoribosylamine--glycine ligase [Patescibacteria group bacterium]